MNDHIWASDPGYWLRRPFKRLSHRGAEPKLNDEKHILFYGLKKVVWYWNFQFMEFDIHIFFKASLYIDIIIILNEMKKEIICDIFITVENLTVCNYITSVRPSVRNQNRLKLWWHVVMPEQKWHETLWRRGGNRYTFIRKEWEK